MASVHGTLMHNDTSLYLTFNGVYLSDVSFVVTLVLNVMYGAVFTNT